MAECQRCQFQQIVSALSTLVQTYPRRMTSENGKEKVAHINRAELTLREANNPKVAHAAKAFVSPFGKLVDFINSELLPLARKVCLSCSLASNDDNLTSRGKSLVSLDAMPNGVMLGTDPAPSGRGSWLTRNQIHRPSTAGSDGVTALPSHYEDMMRKALADFLALDYFEQFMVLHQMLGTTMTDFATMKWVPYEMKKPQSKEFVDYRWRRLVTRFPLALALRKATPLLSKGVKRGKTGFSNMVQGELDFPRHSPTAKKERKGEP